MNKEEIQKIYKELESLSVKVEKNPQRGMDYLHEKMVECRQKQDQVTDLLLKLNRERAGTRIAVRNLKAQLELILDQPAAAREVPESQEALREARAGLRTYEDQEDEFRYLSEVISAKQSNLKMTSSDIRLLCSIVETQIRLGEVTPGNRRDNRVSTPNPPAPQPDAPEQPTERQISETVPQTDLAPSTPTDSGVTSDVLSIDEFLNSEATPQ